MNYVSFRGVRSDTLGLYIAKNGMPSHRKAKQRYTEYEIPGRNGAVHIFDGYSPIDIKVIVQLFDATADIRQIVNAWADGTGDLFTSDDTSRVWKASVLKEVQYKRLVYDDLAYDTATITFRCQPAMRERVPTVVTLEKSGKLKNIGNIETQPKIVVYGSGECKVRVGGKTITLSDVSESVTIDSETGYVYSASGAVAMNGEFPTLGTEDTAVSFSGGTTKVEITPNWGWI